MDKPGWKTSEFWVTAAEQTVGMLAASGAFANNMWVQLAGVLLSAVSGLTYKQSRTKAKTVPASEMFPAKPVAVKRG